MKPNFFTRIIASIVFWWRNRSAKSVEIDRDLPEFPTISKMETVVENVGISDLETPLKKEYLDELEENEKCAPICKNNTKNNAFIKAMEFSATAQRLGINNTMPKEFRQNALALKKEILNPLMDATGWTYRVTSGFRNDRVNSEVGGATNSLHRFAQAVDFVCYRSGVRVPVIEVARKMRDLGLPIRMTILYGTFTHADHVIGGENNRSVSFHSSHKGERVL